MKPDEKRAPAAAAHEPAAGDSERRLVEIWERTFDRRPIGVDDSFSDLGGDSLLAIELFLQIEEEFGERMPFDVLLEAPTIRSMSRLLEQVGRNELFSVGDAASRRARVRRCFACRASVAA